MKIIEITALDNGAHRNQEGTFHIIPSGWARIPENITIPDTFPFVNIEVDEQVVTTMTAGIVPEPVPESASIPTQEERLSALEEAMLAMMGVSADV